MLPLTPIKIKYCSICVVSIGLAYFLFKSPRILKFLRYTKKFLQKNNTYVVSSDYESHVAVGELRRILQKSEKQIVGLDCEWVSTKSKRHPVALLQLATPDGFCSIFRLSVVKSVPVDLQMLLEDKNVLKVGVAVVIDAHYLLADYGVRCEGCLDLRYLASQVGVESSGLASLAKELFGIELDKDWRIRCSNWESEVLSAKQVQYAAQDACIAVKIFEALNHKEICRQFSIWQRLRWSKTDYWNNSINIWSKFIGLNFKSHQKTITITPTSQSTKRLKTFNKKNSDGILQRRFYSNIFLLAPDDEVLCTISDTKAAWYLDKELADTVCEDPKTLKLKFEPSRRPTEPDGYYTKPKDNKCVVCASDKDLRRKNVVPSEYRRYFEESLKNHQFHDVLLLCLPCHIRTNMSDQQLRDQLVIECNAPLADGRNPKFREMPDVKALRSAARALYYSGDVIPKERQTQLQAVIIDKLGVSAQLLTQQFLENIINIDCHVESENYVPHGLTVVQYYLTHGGVEQLERRWRQHFIDTMSPKYMPPLWSINYTRN